MFFECFWNRLVQTLKKKTKNNIEQFKKKTLLLAKLATIVSPRRARFLFESVEKEAEPQDEDPRKNQQSSRTKTTLHHFYNSLPSLAYSTTRAHSRFFKYFLYIFRLSMCVCVRVRARARTYILFASRSVAYVFGIHTITQSQGFYLAQKKRGRKKSSLRFSKGTRTRGEKTNLMYTACVFLEKKERTKQTFRNNIYRERNSFRFVSFTRAGIGVWAYIFRLIFRQGRRILFFLRFRPKKKLWLVCVCVCVRSVLPKRGNFWLATRKGSY